MPLLADIWGLGISHMASKGSAILNFNLRLQFVFTLAARLFCVKYLQFIKVK